MKVITRFPPSPTGYFHIGSARTALFNYLYAAHEHGEMCLRFEDTDKERSKPEFEKDIVENLAWLGIPYTKPEIFRQSERTDIYRGHLKRLIEAELAYEAEEATDDATKKVIRFKNPNTRITFTDLLRGDVSFDTSDLKDFVIARSIDDPLYHLAVVIDDHDMGVTHVIRGEDHISNTPRQILILEALGFTRPVYAHIPLILAPDKTKLSKRHGAVSISEYRAEGYLPEALINYLALLGWNPGGDREIFSLSELVDAFSIERVHKGGAVFDIEKLKWFNRQYLQSMTDATFHEYIAPAFPKNAASTVQALLPLLRQTISTSGELRKSVAAGEYEYFFTAPSPDAAAIPNKASDAGHASLHLTYVRDTLENLPDTAFASSEPLKAALWEYATEHGRGSVLWPLRYALSGRERSPDPFIIASIIGKSETLQRIATALAMLKQP